MLTLRYPLTPARPQHHTQPLQLKLSSCARGPSSISFPTAASTPTRSAATNPTPASTPTTPAPTTRTSTTTTPPPPQQQQPLLQPVPEEQPREKDMNRADELRAALPAPMTRSRRRWRKLATQTMALSRKNWCVRALAWYGGREGWMESVVTDQRTDMAHITPNLRSLTVLAHT